MFPKGTRLEKANLQNGTIAFAMRPGGPSCILFLHGLGCSKESFMDAFTHPYFDATATLLAPDFLGHGDSDRNVVYSYDLQSQAELIRELLDRLGIVQIAIVAHSMANVVGLALAQFDLEVLGFYCLEGNLIAEDCTLSARVAKNAERQFVEKIYPLTKEKFVGKIDIDVPSADPIALYRMSKSLTDHCLGYRQLSMFLELPISKTYLHGEVSASLPVLSKLSGIDVISVPNAGHFLMNDNPGFVYSAIAERL